MLEKEKAFLYDEPLFSSPGCFVKRKDYLLVVDVIDDPITDPITSSGLFPRLFFIHHVGNLFLMFFFKTRRRTRPRTLVTQENSAPSM